MWGTGLVGPGPGGEGWGHRQEVGDTGLGGGLWLEGEDGGGRRQGYRQGLVSAVVQAPCPRLPRLWLSLFLRAGGSVSEKEKQSLRVSGFLRTVSTSSQNYLLQTHPRAPA